MIMPSFCPDCLEAAANDPRFVAWAVARGLAFDLGQAWERSGAYYWTAEIDDVLRVDPPRLLTGQRMEPEQARAHMVVRDILARNACRYYAAYLDGVPPDHSKAVRPCNCETV